MTSILITALIGLVPVPIIYVFYTYYFSIRHDILRHAEFFAYGMLLAPLVLATGPYLTALIPTGGVVALGFLHIALVEKIGAFAIILLLTRRTRSRLPVSTVVALAMFLGMGFATVENIIFAATASTSVLLVRFMSAVPLHVLSCGLLGYYLALRALSASRLYRIAYFAAAFCVPVLFHGLYDSFILLGGRTTFYTAALLFLLMVMMEYRLAKSQVLPTPRSLDDGHIALEDWQTIERQPQFERWILRSMGARNATSVPFFRLSFSWIKRGIVLAIVCFGTWFLFKGSVLVRALGIPLTGEESVVVFVLIPVLYAVQLVLVGIVNPEYFKTSIIRIPIIIDTLMSIDVDTTKRDDVIDTVSYHITGLNAFVKTPVPLVPGARVRCIMYGPHFSSPTLECVVAWDYHKGPEPLNGTLVRFETRPPGFWGFLVRYYIFRVIRGVIFNMRLPGFRSIRSLFVRPVSVMQEEMHLPAGQVIFRQGDPGDRFYLIRHGQVDILKTFSSGKEMLITTLTRGDIFGEMALVGSQPRIATAVCRSDCLVAIADPANLDALIRSNPSFTRTLIETFAGRFQESDAALFESMQQMNCSMHTGERLIIALMGLLLHGARTGDGTPGDSSPVEIDVNRIAIALGCGREKVLDILRVVNESQNEDELLNGVDGSLQALIMRVFGARRIALREKI